MSNDYGIKFTREFPELHFQRRELKLSGRPFSEPIRYFGQPFEPTIIEKIVTLNPNGDRAGCNWLKSESSKTYYYHIKDGIGSGADDFWLSANQSGEVVKVNLEDAPADMIKATEIKCRVRVKYGQNISASDYGYQLNLWYGGTLVGTDSILWVNDITTPIVVDHTFSGLDLTPDQVNILHPDILSIGGSWTLLAAQLDISGFVAVVTYEANP